MMYHPWTQIQKWLMQWIQKTPVNARMVYHLKNQWIKSTIFMKKEKKSHDHLNRWRKGIWQCSTPIHDKNFQQNRNKYNFFNLQLTSHATVKDNTFSPKIRSNEKMLALTTSIQHCTGGLRQYSKKKKLKHKDWNNHLYKQAAWLCIQKILRNPKKLLE